MALLFKTGFDKTTTTDEDISSHAGGVTIGAFGRNGTNGLKITSAFSNPARGVVNLGGQFGTVIAAFALKPVTTISTRRVISFDDNGTVQAAITIDADGTVHATGTATTFTLPDAAYRHWQVKCVLHNSAGAWTIKLDNVTVLNVTGLDTTATANNYATQFKMGDASSEAVSETWFDDLILMDTSGSTFNDFIGDKRVVEQLPTGDSATMQFTPSTGTAGYAMVDDSDPDDDATYIEDSTVGHIARFTFPSLPVASGAVACADVVWFGRKTDAGTRTLKGNVKSSASIATGADTAMPTSYAYGTGHFETDPNGGGAWTVASVNAAEFGVEVVA